MEGLREIFARPKKNDCLTSCQQTYGNLIGLELEIGIAHSTSLLTSTVASQALFEYSERRFFQRSPAARQKAIEDLINADRTAHPKNLPIQQISQGMELNPGIGHVLFSLASSAVSYVSDKEIRLIRNAHRKK